jgi:hypothetical protein
VKHIDNHLKHRFARLVLIAVMAIWAMPAIMFAQTPLSYRVKQGDTLFTLAGIHSPDQSELKALVILNQKLAEPSRTSFDKQGRFIVVLYPGENLVGLDGLGLTVTSEAATLRKELAELRASEKELRSEASILALDKGGLEYRLKELAEIGHLREEELRMTRAQAESRHSLSSLLGVGVAGIASGFALAFFTSFRREKKEKKMAVLPPEVLRFRDNDGVEHVCLRKGIVESPPGSGILKGNYACPLGCGVPRLFGESLAEHVNEKCPRKSAAFVQGPKEVLAKANLM